MIHMLRNHSPKPETFNWVWILRSFLMHLALQVYPSVIAVEPIDVAPPPRVRTIPHIVPIIARLSVKTTGRISQFTLGDSRIVNGVHPFLTLRLKSARTTQFTFWIPFDAEWKTELCYTISLPSRRACGIPSWNFLDWLTAGRKTI